MKLHVYEQDNSNLRWVRDEPLTLEEMLDMRVKFIGYVDKADYIPIGMGYYRHIKEG